MYLCGQGKMIKLWKSSEFRTFQGLFNIRALFFTVWFVSLENLLGSSWLTELMYRWTRKSPLNSTRPPDPDSRSAFRIRTLDRDRIYLSGSLSSPGVSTQRQCGIILAQWPSASESISRITSFIALHGNVLIVHCTHAECTVLSFARL